jgi:hypothetical protein
MPHVNTLRRLSTIFTVSAGLENNEQVNYLRLRARDLDERQRFVCLQMDEIHVNPTLAFKGGNVSGHAQNSADLERRFGEYRQLSGGNYNVSVQQVLKSRKNCMCVSSFLALNSNKLGHIAITDIRGALSMNNSEELNDDEEQKVDDFVDVPLDVKNSNFLTDAKVVDGVDDCSGYAAYIK